MAGKTFRFAVLAAAACLLTGCPSTPRTLPPIEVYFSPKGGCTEAIVREIEQAQAKVLVQAYSFTSAPIAKALVEARDRGVHIQVILDDSQKTEKYSEADFLHHAGIPVLMDGKHAIAHNKIMVLDDQVVITGSFNFTKQAETSNAENLLIIRDAPIAAEYTQNWELHAAHSQIYQGRSVTESSPQRERFKSSGNPGGKSRSR